MSVSTQNPMPVAAPILKAAALTAKVAAMSRDECIERAMEIGLQSGSNPTDDERLEFVKLVFGPDAELTD